MTHDHGTIPAPATRRTPDDTARLLACLAFVLVTMALVLLISGLLVSPLDDSTGVCRAEDASTGECLLAVRMGKLHTTLVLNGAATLVAGAAASGLGALVLRGSRR